MFNLIIIYLLFKLSTIYNLYFFKGLIISSTLNTSVYLVKKLSSFNYTTKYNVLLIQVMGLFECDKELRAIRIWASICHWQQSFLGVGQEIWLIVEFIPVDALSPSSILIGDISSLHHEPLDNSMENVSFVPHLGPFLSSTDGSKILDSLWNDILEKFKYQSTLDISSTVWSLS